ncbi:MAG: Rid family detoxifying hydrolase [Simkania sp.]|nr:Rid family detoxifying hydrolase [Simkania sp.]
MLQDIRTTEAPSSALYSQAVRANGFLFLSGQIAVDQVTGTLITGDISEQFHKVFDQIEAILRAATLTLAHVVRVEIYLENISDFPIVNALYLKRIPHHPKPVRQAMQVGHLPMGAKIEISCIAVENL